MRLTDIRERPNPDSDAVIKRWIKAGVVRAVPKSVVKRKNLVDLPGERRKLLRSMVPKEMSLAFTAREEFEKWWAKYAKEELGFEGSPLLAPGYDVAMASWRKAVHFSIYRYGENMDVTSSKLFGKEMDILEWWGENPSKIID